MKTQLTAANYLIYLVKKNTNTGNFYMKIRNKCLLQVYINLEKRHININLAKNTS